MESRETFVVTLFCDPERSTEPRGRLRHVLTNQEATFRDLKELNSLLVDFSQRGGTRSASGAAEADPRTL